MYWFEAFVNILFIKADFIVVQFYHHENWTFFHNMIDNYWHIANFLHQKHCLRQIVCVRKDFCSTCRPQCHMLILYLTGPVQLICDVQFLKLDVTWQLDITNVRWTEFTSSIIIIHRCLHVVLVRTCKQLLAFRTNLSCSPNR